MDWKSLRATLPKVSQLPQRASDISALDRVLDGTQYDEIEHPFSREATESGEYIPLEKRRPSARTNLCRVVVEDSVSLLFSEEHWPPVHAKSDGTIKALTKFAKHVRLNEVMLEAATRGSVGSVAILLKVFNNRPFFEVMHTAFLTPTWLPDNPEELQSVRDLHPTTGAELRDLGYSISTEDVTQKYWFKRIWDQNDDTWYNPVKQSDAKEPLTYDGWIKDEERSTKHGLGFCPIVWIRNLPTTKRLNGCDGASTFEIAIDTVIEADFLLSQGGRGLKYAADPTLVIKNGGMGEEGPVKVGGAARALEIDVDGDAKLLEINGAAAKAVIEHVTYLRSVVLESVHGNRANADRLSAATSGRSIELMMSGLIALADRLRISYGEGGLLKILRMVCRATDVIENGLIIGFDKAEETLKSLDSTDLELRWPQWMPALPRDILETAQALDTAVDTHVISRETAVTRMSHMLDVDDSIEEFKRVTADVAEERAEDDRVAQRDADLAGQVKANLNQARAEAA